MAAVKALQQWCKLQCEGYRDVSVTNMTTSFRDGLAFCALIHKHRPDLIDFDSLNKENIYGNNQQAFEVAERELGIPALLDAEDMVALKVPDRLSILTYVSQYYNYFHGRSPIGGMGGIKRPAEEPREAPSEKKNAHVIDKFYPSSKPAPENKTPKAVTENKREVLTERANKSITLTSSCTVCQSHVHLVQRHLVDGKLYHRNCFKCKECSNILLSGTYKAGKEPGTFICKIHTSIKKPQNFQNTHITAPPKTQSTFIIKADQSTSAGGTGKADFSPKTQSWVTGKSDQVPLRGVMDTPKSALQLRPVPKSTPAQETSAFKAFTGLRNVTEPLKPVCSSVQKNQDARKRFFEPGSTVTKTEIPSSYASSSSVSPTRVISSPETPPGAGAGRGAGRVLLRVGDWAKTPDSEKEKMKESEKEKAKDVIGMMVKVEKNSSTPFSSNTPVGLKANSNISPMDSSAKGPSGRVRLKALDAGGETTCPGAAVPSWIREKNPRPVSTLSPSSKENSATPSDWRAMLKPVSKPVRSTEAPPLRKIEAASSPRKPDLGNSSVSKTSAVAPFTSSISVSISSSKTLLFLNPEKNSLKPKNPSSVPVVRPAQIESDKLSKPGHIPKEDIQRELKEIEKNMNELQKRGVELEKQLRQCDEDGEEDTLMNDLMVDWFTLIQNKQVFLRRESELVYIEKTQDLEEEQPSVDAQLRKLMEKPEHLKTLWDRKREDELMAKLVEIVNDRNAIVEGLDEDRLREEEEDEQLNQLMQSFDIKKDKHRKKSPISRWFSMRSKRPSTDD